MSFGHSMSDYDRLAQERKAKRELEDLEYERDRQERDARAAQREAERQATSARYLRSERDSLSEELASLYEERDGLLTELTELRAAARDVCNGETCLDRLRQLLGLTEPKGG